MPKTTGKLNKSASHANLRVGDKPMVLASGNNTKSSSSLKKPIEKDANDGGDGDEISRDDCKIIDDCESHDHIKLATLTSPKTTTSTNPKSRSRQTVNGPIIRLATNDTPEVHVEHAPRRRRLSEEEVGDIAHSDHYFGERARDSFYARYRALHLRPYLFGAADKSEDEARLENNSKVKGSLDSISRHQLLDNDDDEEATHFVPKFPSSRELQRMSTALKPSSLLSNSGKIDDSGSHLPMRDALSPRSHFLAGCVTHPRLALPFLLRDQPTTTFDFSFQSLGDEFIAEFAECLERDLPFIEEILVRDNRLSDAGLDTLLKAISNGSTMLRLTRLDISQNEIGSRSAQTLQAYIVSSHCTLRTLLVDCADIDDRECAAFMTAFEKNLSIRTLCMSRNGIGKLETLNVVRPSFVTGGEAIANMLRVNLVLAKLDLSWNFLRLGSSIEVARSLRDNGTLVELNLAYNGCGDSGAMALGEALRFNHVLRVLDLSANSVGYKGAMVLATAVRATRTLRSLQMNGNAIGREGGQALLLALTGNTSEFEIVVGLSGCNLSTRTSSASVSEGFAPTSTNQPPPGSAPSGGASKGALGTKGKATASGSSSADPDVNMQGLPLYNTLSSRVFDIRNPSGRYQLSLSEAYDKMIIMELIRLAAARRGCRFLRIEHRPNAASAAGKRSVSLIRKETAPKLSKDKFPVLSSPSPDDENDLETKGIEVLFSHIDHDNSGSIDCSEVLAVLNRIGLFPSEEQVAKVFDQFDFNSSGFLEQREFAGFFFHAVYRLVDADGSGKIDADEVDEALKLLGLHQYNEQDIIEAIAIFDLTGDGEMEEAEFIEFIKGMLLDRITRELQLPDTTCSSSSSEGADFPVLAVAMLDSSTQKPWVIPDNGCLEVDFVYDRESFATSEEADRVGKISARGIEHLISNVAGSHIPLGERDELFLTAVRDSEMLFTAAQAHELLRACGYLDSEDLCIANVAVLLPQMLTVREAQVLVSRTLSLPQRCRLKREMGSAYSVALGNPTAHYSFDLARGKDRIALRKLAEVAQSEKLFSKQRSKRGDTSQHGNWENFRNEELDGKPVVISSAFFRTLPARGKLCFDYVSTSRPRRGTRPMSDRRFRQLIDALQMDVVMGSLAGVGGNSNGSTSSLSSGDGDEHRSAGWARTRASVLRRGWRMLASDPSMTQLSGASRDLVALQLVQLEAAVCDRWLSSAQAAQIVACMPAAFRARPETARVLFSRVIDLDGFHRLVDALGEDDRRFLVRALGWLNVVNPLVPERRYELDLSVSDEREMTKILVALAIAEPGENWVNQSFSAVRGEPGIPGWKLPVRWEKEDRPGKDDDDGGVNRSGFLALEYDAGPERGCAPVLSARRALMARTLCGTRLYFV